MRTVVFQGDLDRMAVLIASAPDLLDVLRDIVRAEWTAVSLHDMTPQHRGRLERARGLIAKVGCSNMKRKTLNVRNQAIVLLWLHGTKEQDIAELFELGDDRIELIIRSGTVRMGRPPHMSPLTFRQNYMKWNTLSKSIMGSIWNRGRGN